MVTVSDGGSGGDRDIHRDSGRPFFKPDNRVRRFVYDIIYIFFSAPRIIV